MNKKTKNKKKIIISVVISALILITGVLVFALNKKEPIKNIYVVSRGEIISEVSLTGKVVPQKNIELSFEKSGRVTKINKKTSENVSLGEVLIELENLDILAQIKQAEASVKTQEVKLEELKKGTREEEIKVKEAELKKAEQDLLNYYSSIKDIINDAYAKADDAIRTKTDELFLNDETETPTLNFVATNSQAQIDVIAQRIKSGSELNVWRKEIQTLSSETTNENLLKALEEGKQHLTVFRDFLTRALDVLDNPIGISASSLSTYKSNIYTGRTNINTSYSNLNTQSQYIASQKATIQKIRDELFLKTSGSTNEQIKAQEAQVEQAKANELYYRSQYEKTILRAPFAGLITKIDIEVGDIASAGKPVLMIIGKGKFHIEANVAESDISKIKIGNTANVTLDAYGKDVKFEAKVISIDLSETIIDGVATYKTTFEFLIDDQKILSGLTSNINMIVDKKENAIYIPSRNIFTKDGKKMVKVLIDEEKNQTMEREIATGIRGSDGKTEILGGVIEGEKILSE